MFKHFNKSRIVSFVIICVCFINNVYADTIPPKLVTCDYTKLLSIRDSAQTGQGNYLASYKKLVTRANTLLSKVPDMVTNGDLPPTGDAHDFYAIGKFAWPNPNTPDGMPYIRKDGDHNEEAFGPRYDLTRFQKTVDDVNTLCLAWFYTEDEQYALKAKDLLTVWFLDSASRMNPNMNCASALPGVYDGMPIGIIFSVILIEMVDHVKLLGMSQSWDTASDNALKAWFSDYVEWLDTSDFGIEERAELNNHGTWYSSQVAAYCIYAGDTTMASDIFERAKIQVGQQMAANGSLPLELNRVDSFHYSVYGLRAFSVLARALEIMGYNLWSYTTPDNKNLLLAFQYLVPYLMREQVWNYGGTVELTDWGLIKALVWAQEKYQTTALDSVINYMRIPLEDGIEMDKLYVYFGETANSALLPDNLLVVRAGDGSASPSGSVPVAIQEYSASGIRKQTIFLPVSTSGINRKFTLSSLTASEGLVTLSSDKNHVTLVGYDAVPGSSGLAQTNASSVNRVVAFINQAGVVNTSLRLNNNYNLAPRSAVTDNGTNIWIAGSSGGVKYASAATTTPTVVNLTASFSPRFIDIFNGGLYTSIVNTSPLTRLGKIGSGLPTSPTQSVTGLPGFAEGTGSQNAFVFFDTDNDSIPDLLYVADDVAGLMKYHFSGTAWVAKGTVAISGFANNALRGLIGKYDSSTGYTLFGSTLSSVLKIVDNTLPAATITASPVEIIAAPENRTFKGVCFTPESTVLSLHSRSSNSSFQVKPVSGKGIFDVFANETSLNLVIGSEIRTSLSVQMVNIMGQQVLTENVHLEKGLNERTFDLTSMPSGIYIVICKERNQVKKIHKP